ncbi:MAG TPA: carbonic anhydrase family protein [Candidatus Acidoferrales bacterium]
MRKFWMTIVLLMIAAILFPDGPRAQWRTQWSYDGALGPEHWGDLDPEYAACKTGREQSPIDIQSAEKSALPAIRFEYKSGPLKIINNGYTAVRVNYPAGNGNFLIVGDKRYELTQFHFHHPSEEQIHGKPSDMVIHFMHASADGKVAGVAILLKAGGANTVIQQLWQYMPQTAGAEHEIPGVQINPVGLLPHNSAENAGPYYTYMGSQTAPPCTEGVTWFVLKTPMEISAQEIAAFAKLYPHDVRPVQPLNGRIVKESQ